MRLIPDPDDPTVVYVADGPHERYVASIFFCTGAWRVFEVTEGRSSKLSSSREFSTPEQALQALPVG